MENQFFKKAHPVWMKGLQQEINCTCGLYTSVSYECGKHDQLSVAAAGFYRVFVNGDLIHSGPARCAHGFYRVDVIDLTPFLNYGVNHIAIEAVHYNINSFYCPYQPPFIQAEIVELEGGTVLAATSAEDVGFCTFRLDERVQKVQRFSFQRGIGECYRLDENSYSWRSGVLRDKIKVEMEQSEKKALINRRIPLNTYSMVFPQSLIIHGNVRTGIIPDSYKKDRSLTQIDEKLLGFREEELEIHLSDEVQEMVYTKQKILDEPYSGRTLLKQGTYDIFRLPGEKSGFICADIECLQDGILYLMVDETLICDDVDPLSMDCLNVLKIEMKKGCYPFQSFEVFGFQYLKAVCTRGEFILRNIHVKEMVYPLPLLSKYTGDSFILTKIYKAAKETFRQNATDIFMDCPTRERAGWLCDSFFTARAEWEFTGTNTIEKNFLENFLLPDHFDHIPAGMLPMCYPADHFDGVFIPNWAMWFVLELYDYQKRTGDSDFVRLFRRRVYDLIDYFQPFENEYGLLENLKSWVFIEWSKANELVQNVNYPSNMLYSAMLKCAGDLYGDMGLCKKSEKIVETVRQRSFDGDFFVDNEVRNDGVLQRTGERTETCQYYAFFFNIATPETYPVLWKRLVKEFGPQRAVNGGYPEIYLSNAFIGNYLRLDVLSRHGFYQQVLEEIKGYFLYMADKTGTLWENVTDNASCNHGFASYTAYLISQATKATEN